MTLKHLKVKSWVTQMLDVKLVVNHHKLLHGNSKLKTLI